MGGKPSKGTPRDMRLKRNKEAARKPSAGNIKSRVNRQKEYQTVFKKWGR